MISLLHLFLYDFHIHNETETQLFYVLVTHKQEKSSRNSTTKSCYIHRLSQRG